MSHIPYWYQYCSNKQSPKSLNNVYMCRCMWKYSHLSDMCVYQQSLVPALSLLQCIPVREKKCIARNYCKNYFAETIAEPEMS